MTGLAAPRAQFGLVLPSTNTAVEAEFAWMRAEGVSWHTGRIFIPEPELDDDDSFLTFVEGLRTEIGRAVRDVVTAKVDYLVMGMSAETFWGGKDGAAKFRTHMAELSGGLGVTTGAEAVDAAMAKFGAKRLGVITPYQPVGDAQVRAFLEETGYEVVALEGLKCSSATSIADATPEELEAAFEAVNDSGVEALLQVGTNLVCSRVAAEMERKLDKPVVAINTATVWHAYRTNGIEDRIDGFGSLLRDY